MRFTEHDRLSAEIAQWARAWLPDNVFFTVIAHGGRFPAMALKLRQIGTESGFPDILLISGGDAFVCELKTGAGMLRTDQRVTRDRLLQAGASFAVIHSLDEFIGTLKGWSFNLLHHPRIDPFGADQLPW